MPPQHAHLLADAIQPPSSGCGSPEPAISTSPTSPPPTTRSRASSGATRASDRGYRSHPAQIRGAAALARHPRFPLARCNRLPNEPLQPPRRTLGCRPCARSTPASGTATNARRSWRRSRRAWTNGARNENARGRVPGASIPAVRQCGRANHRPSGSRAQAVSFARPGIGVGLRGCGRTPGRRRWRRR